MSERIFRKSSLNRVNSPEQLNEYIRVARPGVWITLAAIVLLLAGVICWGALGYVNTRVNAQAAVKSGAAEITLTGDDEIKTGMTVEINGVSGEISAVSADFTKASANLPGLADGVYEAEITLERIHPISFILQ